MIISENEINTIFQNIIESKKREIELTKESDKNFNLFWQINTFEANAVGQVGEEFIKTLLKEAGIINHDTISSRKTIHDEYDIKIGNVKIEIKTARKGQHNTFQFNGFNPKYNWNLAICIGITDKELCYLILEKTNLFSKYEHSKRENTWWIKLKSETTKKLVCMNPKNDTNYKITLKFEKDMNKISEFLEEISYFLNKYNNLN